MGLGRVPRKENKAREFIFFVFLRHQKKNWKVEFLQVAR